MCSICLCAHAVRLSIHLSTRTELRSSSPQQPPAAPAQWPAQPPAANDLGTVTAARGMSQCIWRVRAQHRLVGEVVWLRGALPARAPGGRDRSGGGGGLLSPDGRAHQKPASWWGPRVPWAALFSGAAHRRRSCRAPAAAMAQSKKGGVFNSNLFAL